MTNAPLKIRHHRAYARLLRLAGRLRRREFISASLIAVTRQGAVERHELLPAAVMVTAGRRRRHRPCRPGCAP